jgi:hypothetical protein
MRICLYYLFASSIALNYCNQIEAVLVHENLFSTSSGVDCRLQNSPFPRDRRDSVESDTGCQFVVVSDLVKSFHQIHVLQRLTLYIDLLNHNLKHFCTTPRTRSTSGTVGGAVACQKLRPECRRRTTDA